VISHFPLIESGNFGLALKRGDTSAIRSIISITSRGNRFRLCFITDRRTRLIGVPVARKQFGWLTPSVGFDIGHRPEAKGRPGYYVCPFLLGDTLVARCELKADRARKIRMIRSAFLENGQDTRRVVPDVACELRHMQSWVELDGIEVSERGDLARMLQRSVRQAVRPKRRAGVISERG